MQTRPALEDGNESPPRFYHIFLQEDLMGGWTLVRETGRQGSSGKVTKQYYPTWDEALDALMTLRDKQLKRGYQVVFLQGQAAPDD